jgi:hypothetical protein
MQLKLLTILIQFALGHLIDMVTMYTVVRHQLQLAAGLIPNRVPLLSKPPCITSRIYQQV